MQQLVLAGDPPVTIVIKRNARARQISLRVSQLDGRVSMSLPRWTPPDEAAKFAREKEAWIRRHLADRVDSMVPTIGGQVLLEGVQVPIVAGVARSVRFEDGTLAVPGAPEIAPRRISAFMKVLARQRLSAACDHYSGRLGMKYSRLTLRDTRSRWGSCTTDGNLMFSWRLIMAPSEILEYVAAHEVAHLAEMNHSPAYWQTLASIYPDYKAPRLWLRKNGQHLHAYRFGN